jgi:hypothetical protein
MVGRVGIVFTGNRAKETVLPTSASPSADYVPIKDGDRVSASDPMTALLVYVGGTAQRLYRKHANERSQFSTITHAIIYA